MNKKDKELILEMTKIFSNGSCNCCPIEKYKEELSNYHNSITSKNITACAKRAGTIYLLFGGNAKYFLKNFMVGKSVDCDKFIEHLREFLSKNKRVLKI